jgi:predicted nucleotidyltransferase
MVPFTKVKKYYKPIDRLQEILKTPNDGLEKKVVDLTRYLTDITDVESEDIGITGSVLLNIHNPDLSDIDLVIYGKKASKKIKEAIKEAKNDGTPISALSEKRKDAWLEDRSKRFLLNKEDLIDIENKRWNYGFFKGTYFSIHPTRVDNEISEKYGDNVYHQIGLVEGRAKIADARESIYLPAVYRVKDSCLNSNVEVAKIISFESMFCDVFDKGEKIEFRGILEKVTGIDEGYQVIVGAAGFGGGFIKPNRG